jgi:hypothetical protein
VLQRSRSRGVQNIRRGSDFDLVTPHEKHFSSF